MTSLKTLLIASSLLAASACGHPTEEVPPSPMDAGKRDASSVCRTVLCGEECCAEGDVCDAATGTCAPPCTPRCTGKVCGSDGCGGTCAPGCGGSNYCVDGQCVPCPSVMCGGACCPIGDTCNPATNRCETACVPNCTGRVCGSDGCGGSCGPGCGAGQSCSAAGQCACVPNCSGKQCGPDGCGGSCGPGCAAGFVCGGSGRCITAPCDPPCANGQECDASMAPPVCLEICNPPFGCKLNVETCNELTRACEPLSCGGSRCEFGQGCYDPVTGSAGSTCTCLPERDSGGRTLPDTCESYGKVCDYDENNPGPSRCRLPGDKEFCVPSVGCQAGSTCTSYSGTYLCLTPCQRGADCPDVMDMCLPNTPSMPAALRNKCWYNICATPDSVATPSAERAKYFKPCDSAATLDGTCIPLTTRGSSGGIIDIGVCFQAGTAPSLGRCDPDADRTQMTDLCPVNQLCSGVQPSPTVPGRRIGICTPLCNGAPAPSPVTGCATGKACIDVSGVDQSYPPTGTAQLEARLGMCIPSCNLFGTDLCAPDVLGNPQGCAPTAKLDGSGQCMPLRYNATGAGGACGTVASGDFDIRLECGDRLTCTSTTTGSMCTGYCDTRVCSSQTAVCGSCRPANLACKPLGGAAVGACGVP